MIGFGIFIVVYILSVYICGKLDDASGTEETALNYIPVFNTVALILVVVIGVLWAFIQWLRKLGRK